MKITADYIFPGNGSPIRNGIVVVGDDGRIEALIDPAKESKPGGEILKYRGIICPGFVNTHCHLELSYLKGKIAENTQLHGFVEELMAIRDQVSEQKRWSAIQLAEQEMIRNGIVAVGDISNGNTSFYQKEKNHLKYHTFIEVFGLEEDKAGQIIERARELKNSYFRSTRISLTPHAPYSMSEKLFNLVCLEPNDIFTIHNQETDGENELFRNKEGKLYNQLLKFSDAIKDWQPTGTNSLPSYLNRFPKNKRILLVHNIYTSKEDLVHARLFSDQIYWCFCPNANQYIEGRQPDYSLFTSEKCTIGTDSLASNWGLSMLDELKTITEKNKFIPLEKLIRWATFNGAEFLGFDELGSIEPGKIPGLNLIEDVDLENMTLLKSSKVRPL
ncbi:MAG: amidohydrolase family protein [Flavobacteriales bacterium]|nr:amidohydrolase family protein [Flavobacteriales bacterium]